MAIAYGSWKKSCAEPFPQNTSGQERYDNYTGSLHYVYVCLKQHENVMFQVSCQTVASCTINGKATESQYVTFQWPLNFAQAQLFPTWSKSLKQKMKVMNSYFSVSVTLTNIWKESKFFWRETQHSLVLREKVLPEMMCCMLLFTKIHNVL